MLPTDAWNLGMSVQEQCVSLIQEMCLHKAEMCLTVDVPCVMKGIDGVGETKQLITA
jgi:hypothetical protein